MLLLFFIDFQYKEFLHNKIFFFRYIVTFQTRCSTFGRPAVALDVHFMQAEEEDDTERYCAIASLANIGATVNVKRRLLMKRRRVFCLRFSMLRTTGNRARMILPHG